MPHWCHELRTLACNGISPLCLTTTDARVHVEKQTRAYLYALSTVLLWSTVASAFKLTLRYLDVWQLLLVSTLTATLCLFLILLWQGKVALLYTLQRRELMRLLGFGILNPLCYYLVLFEAYALLPAQVAQALNYTWAITLMLLSVPILGQRVSRVDLLATLLCYAGVVLICFGGQRISATALSGPGIALALGSTLVWALYWLYKTRDPLDPVVSLFASFALSLPLVAGACLVFSDVTAMGTAGILGAVYIGLFEMGITYVLWLLALQHTQATAKISTLIFLSPFLSLFIIHYLVGETIADSTVLGLFMIVLGLLLQRHSARAR